jgi:hypothetical protein
MQHLALDAALQGGNGRQVGNARKAGRVCPGGQKRTIGHTTALPGKKSEDILDTMHILYGQELVTFSPEKQQPLA